MVKRYKKIIFVKDTSGNKADMTRHFATLFSNYLRKEIDNYGVMVVRAADLGIYGQGVVVKILQDKDSIVYANIKEEDIEKIIDRSVKGSDVIDELLYTPKDRQLRLVLRNCGVIDPENIEEYIARDGYAGLCKVLSNLKPEDVIFSLKQSGLRGRGGGGFPTYLKWNFARNTASDQKFIICNADEGDPGAYMDRSVLEGDPHSVIEGMIIAGYTVGANKGFFYIRAEYPLAISRVENAIKQAYEYGILGKNIFGSGFDFDIEIRLGAGAFVCGEETALIASIEGKRGTPQPRPPYPSIKGLWGKPTVINNVETLANVAVIFTKGADWFASIGTDTSKGTKVFALTGKVKNSGLIEVPMGTTLREIVFEIGGGLIANKKIKAVQTGGPSGGVIPEKSLDTPVDYENLQKLGSIMGSGGMIVMSEDDCMVDISKFYLKFCVDESCGKCAPCRIGGYQMLRILERITDAEGCKEDISKLEKISHAMQKASLCGLGQTAPNPVVSTLKYFREEYESHVQDKKCIAGKCKKLIHYEINQEKCVRCGICFINCPVDAIVGSKGEGFRIVQDKCIKCGRCFSVCKFGAVQRD